MENKFIIQEWTTYFDREEGYSNTETFQGLLKDAILYVERKYIHNGINKYGGSIEILKQDYTPLYHISVDSNHQIEPIEL